MLGLFWNDFDINEFIEEINTLLDSVPIMNTNLLKPKVEPLPMSTTFPVPSIIEPPKLELKSLPDKLKYAFLGDLKILPVIISSHLDKDQEGKLLDVLSKHKEALVWTIAGINRISPSMIMHQIHLKENANISRELQMRLNSVLKEVVRAEIMPVRCGYHLPYL